MSLSNAAAKVIRTSLIDDARKIGIGKSGIEDNERGARLLEEYFPNVRCQTALDGTRYIPLEEICEVVEACRVREEESRKAGYDSGNAAGLQIGQAEAKKVFDTFKTAIDATVNQRESILRSAEVSALEIILKVARKVTCDAAKVDVEITASIIKGAIGELVDKRDISVKVNPEHYEKIKSRLDEFEALSTDIRTLKIESDARIEFGGCFIHTPSGDIDARLESQLTIIEEKLNSETT
ncbi:hypothetical protein JYU19_01290 [bacterium AH-315-J21]|nr:hypothetical protein [bacterium AH-315-J21]